MGGARFRDPDVIHAVLSDIVDAYPDEHYGLIFWSHGSAWLPSSADLLRDKGDRVDESGDVLPALLSGGEGAYAIAASARHFPSKSFGVDNDSEADIQALRSAFPVFFDFIAFDACYMGAVEVVAELAGATDWVMASAAEILAYGYPYATVLPHLYADNLADGLADAAAAYYDDYQGREGYLQSAAISVMNLASLMELAGSIGAIYDDLILLEEEDRGNVQQYEPNGHDILYDAVDFAIEAHREGLIEWDELIAVQRAAVKHISVTYHTADMLDTLSLDDAYGISMFVPLAVADDLNVYHETLAWRRMLADIKKDDE